MPETKLVFSGILCPSERVASVVSRGGESGKHRLEWQSESSGRESEKGKYSQKWLGEGAKGLLSPDSENGVGFGKTKLGNKQKNPGNSPK